MTNVTATQIVRDAIQRVYGDATQTVLDQRAAEEIVGALRAAGWASLDEVALLIDAAGGRVTVPNSMLADTKERRVMRWDDYTNDGVTFSTRADA